VIRPFGTARRASAIALRPGTLARAISPGVFSVVFTCGACFWARDTAGMVRDAAAARASIMLRIVSPSSAMVVPLSPPVGGGTTQTSWGR